MGHLKQYFRMKELCPTDQWMAEAVAIFVIPTSWAWHARTTVKFHAMDCFFRNTKGMINMQLVILPTVA